MPKGMPPKGPGQGPGPDMKDVKLRPKKGTFRRVLKTMFQFYPVRLPLVIICIIFSAAVSSIPSIFMQNIIAVIEEHWQSGDWEGAAGQIFNFVIVLVVLYVLSLAAAIIFQRMMAVITQGILAKLRIKMFAGMQKLPIK